MPLSDCSTSFASFGIRSLPRYTTSASAPSSGQMRYLSFPSSAPFMSPCIRVQNPDPVHFRPSQTTSIPSFRNLLHIFCAPSLLIASLLFQIQLPTQTFRFCRWRLAKVRDITCMLRQPPRVCVSHLLPLTLGNYKFRCAYDIWSHTVYFLSYGLSPRPLQLRSAVYHPRFSTRLRHTADVWVTWSVLYRVSACA